MREGDGRSVEVSCFAAGELAEALAGPEPIVALTLRFADEPLGAALIAALEAAPTLGWLRSLTLQSCSIGHEGAVALAASRLLAGLESLRIGDDLAGAAAAALLRSPGVAGLRGLALEIPWDDEGLAALASSPHLGRLEQLDLGWCSPSGARLAQLVRAASLRPQLRARFRRVALDDLQGLVRRPTPDAWEEIGTLLGALLDPSVETCPGEHVEEVMSLARLRERLERWPKGLRCAPAEWLASVLRGEATPALAWADTFVVYRLRGAGLVAEDVRYAEAIVGHGAPRRLDLRYLQLGPYALVSWLKAEFMREVEVLDLCGHALAPEVLAALERLPGLARLHLWGCVRQPDALRRLLKSPLLSRLEGLELAGNRLGDRAAKMIAAAPRARGLGFLGLRDNEIGDEGCAALALAKFAALRELDLSENPIGDRGAAAFERAELPALERLELGYHGQIGDEGCAALARARLPALRRLGLDFCKVGDRGALALVEAVETLPALRELHLCFGNEFTTEGAEALAAAAPLRPELRLNLGSGCNAALRDCEALQASSLARDREA